MGYIDFISVDFAVPKKPYNVLVHVKYGDNIVTHIGAYYGDGKWVVDGTIVNVVEWFPLP